MAGKAEGSVPQVRSGRPGLDLHHPEVSPACMAPPAAIQRRRVGPGRPVMQTPGPPRRPGYRPMNAPQMRSKPGGHNGAIRNTRRLYSSSSNSSSEWKTQS